MAMAAPVAVGWRWRWRGMGEGEVGGGGVEGERRGAVIGSGAPAGGDRAG